MNKNDIQLIIVLITISFILLMFLNLKKTDGEIFRVYYENDIVLEQYLNIDNIYEVNGYNGVVKIEVKNQKIRVIEETSPLHICKNQGSISKANDTLVCLPNKIIIKIESKELDGVIR